MQYVTNLLTLFFTDFNLFMFFLALVFMFIHVRLKGRRIAKAEIVYRWTALFPLGFTALYAGYMHLIYPNFTAATIGWANSPFQFEVAMANFALGFIGILSFNASYGFRLATVIANTIWLWGDAAGHIYQMIKFQDFAVGNAGSWFWMDILIPFILIICITQLNPRKQMRFIR